MNLVILVLSFILLAISIGIMTYAVKKADKCANELIHQASIVMGEITAFEKELVEIRRQIMDMAVELNEDDLK